MLQRINELIDFEIARREKARANGDNAAADSAQERILYLCDWYQRVRNGQV